MNDLAKSKRVVRASANVFYEYVKAHLWAKRSLKVRSGEISSIREFSDILRICEMIIEKKQSNLIEDEYGKLETHLKDSFPSTIFNRDGKLRS
jgi:hypothetical protein